MGAWSLTACPGIEQSICREWRRVAVHGLAGSLSLLSDVLSAMLSLKHFVVDVTRIELAWLQSGIRSGLHAHYKVF